MTRLIRGTSMYAKEIDLQDADFAKSSTVLPAAPGPGQVFYKVKSKVLAPEHFPASSDIGTVTVRYVVEAVNPERAHLAIDAVFVTDAGHHLYASDGSVETAEYAEIITLDQGPRSSQGPSSQGGNRRQPGPGNLGPAEHAGRRAISPRRLESG